MIAVGKLRSPYVAEACADLRKRLSAYFPCAEIEVKAADGSDPRMAMREEAARIVKHLRADEPTWLLDRTGTELSSEELSRSVAAASASGAQRLTLIVAGTYGADPSLVERANFRWSLSRLTFLHEWARMLVLEQLYRAAKILRNEPYHH